MRRPTVWSLVQPARLKAIVRRITLAPIGVLDSMEAEATREILDVLEHVYGVVGSSSLQRRIPKFSLGATIHLAMDFGL